MPRAFYQHRRLPRSTRWDETPARPFEQLPGGWPSTDRTDRVLTSNASARVIVCLPPLSIPSTEDNAPLFGHFRCISTDGSVDTVESLFEAIATHLKPVGGPENCWYGVKVGGVQTYGVTPDRFCTDLRTITDWLADGTRPQPRASTVDTRHVLGAALWPMATGWASVTYRRYSQTDDETVRFGLLVPGLRVDSEPVAAVFEAIDEPEPTVQTLWPERHLTFEGRRNPLSWADRPEGLTEHPPLHGTNPLYRSSPEELSTERLPRALIDPLVQTSTLLYHGTSVGEAAPGLRKMTAVEPPGPDALWVAATYRAVSNRE